MKGEIHALDDILSNTLRTHIPINGYLVNLNAVIIVKGNVNVNLKLIDSNKDDDLYFNYLFIDKQYTPYQARFIDTFISPRFTIGYCYGFLKINLRERPHILKNYMWQQFKGVYFLQNVTPEKIIELGKKSYE